MLENFLDSPSRVHFIGIGGIGMSALATVLAGSGHRVTGSDLRPFPQMPGLEAGGASIFVGPHDGSRLGDSQLVVASSAVSADNPEVVEALHRGIPIVLRGDLLAALMERRRGIAVAGAHGKTTTAAMIASVLLHAGLDPTCIIGGNVPELGGNGRLGGGEFLVAESDESDRSFLKLRPEIAVITNIDLEHMGAYVGEPDLLAAFARFADAPGRSARTVVCADDARIRAMLPALRHAPVTYGLDPGLEITAGELRLAFGSSRFRVSAGGKEWGEVRLQLSGIHNVLNALAAISVSRILGLPASDVVQALARFRGVARRLEKRGSARGVVFYDDYAHHPTEIRATLAAVQSSGRRVVAVFQPHRYTRTRDSMTEFASCFEAADLLFVTEVYAASEPRIPGVGGARLAREVERRRPGGVRFVERSELAGRVCAALQPGDLVLAMGAGDIDRLAEDILRRWSANNVD